RRTTRQGLRQPSLATASTKRSGNQSGLLTSMAAPVSERLRTVQGRLSPLNSMVPAFRTRWRGEVRCSSIGAPDGIGGVQGRAPTLAAQPDRRLTPAGPGRYFGALFHAPARDGRSPWGRAAFRGAAAASAAPVPAFGRSARTGPARAGG